MIARHSNRRRGATLVEVMAMMAVLLIVMAMVALLIETLLKVETSGRQAIGAEGVISRVSGAFRKDVRAFPRAELAGTTFSLLGDPANRSVEYTIETDAVLRQEFAGKTLVRREKFALSKRSAPRFERFESSGKPLWSLVFDRRARKGERESIARPLRVEAALGADLRFAPGGEGSR